MKISPCNWIVVHPLTWNDPQPNLWSPASLIRHDIFHVISKFNEEVWTRCWLKNHLFFREKKLRKSNCMSSSKGFGVKIANVNHLLSRCKTTSSPTRKSCYNESNNGPKNGKNLSKVCPSSFSFLRHVEGQTWLLRRQIGSPFAHDEESRLETCDVLLQWTWQRCLFFLVKEGHCARRKGWGK